MFNYLVDYHVHTNNSFDSRTPMIEQCQRAVEIGLKEIVFTEHFDLNPTDEGLGLFNFDKYSREIEKCRDLFGDKLLVKKGLELGEPHLYYDRHTEFLKEKDFDFLLGSVHYLGNQVLEGNYDGRDEKEVYLEYFSEVLETARIGDFHVLGHLDVLKRYVPSSFKKFMAIDYEEAIREILKIAISRDKGIEINTSGLRQDLKEPLPTIEILEWYKELGGTILTVGSDAHSSAYVGMDIKRVLGIAKDIGFKTISTFTGGKIKEIEI